VLATGAYWRKDGIGRSHHRPIPGFDRADVFTPDDIMADRLPTAGPVVIFDDELFYMAGVLAEKIRKAGLEVTLVTPADAASSWTSYTLELHFINKRLRELGVNVVTAHDLAGFDGNQVEIACGYTGKTRTIPAKSVVAVTARLPHEDLYQALVADRPALQNAGIKSVTRIGDCLAAGFIAHAVHSGHKYARDLDEPPPTGEVTFRRSLPLTVTP
jgi:dimethylamine/trimethylamine dehydrogenase